MTTMPFDCTRCAGVRDDAGHLVHPCNKCRRVLLAEPAGERSPWFAEPPRQQAGARCDALWRIPDASQQEAA